MSRSRRAAVINVVGLASRIVGSASAPRISRLAESSGGPVPFRPVFPAVTCSAQASLLTGLTPSCHGIVGNGWYDRQLAEHHFWKQSNHLVAGEKLWETIGRERGAKFTCAKLFWWFNMYSTADWSVTPRPMYPADGRKVFDIYTEPADLRFEIKKSLGEFPFPRFWGPGAGLASSEWIAAAARWVEKKHRPDLSLIYLPHLDYDLQRFGTRAAESDRAVREVDRLVGELADFFSREGVEMAIVSEYGITDVRRPVHLNREFRRRGWIRLKDELGLEMIDLGASRAFAIADHQAAHVYVNDPALLGAVQDALARCDGVGAVLDADGKRAAGIDHPRAGDLIAIAEPDSWFTYYYWMDDDVAPDFARCVDIHRKPGYDPAELFLDPKLAAPKLRIAAKLLRKRLGFRTLLDVVPLDASLVRGSHGRVPDDSGDWPVLIAPAAEASDPAPLDAIGVHRALLQWLRGSRD